MRTKTVVLFLLSALVCAAAINPAIQWSTSVPGAGFAFFDPSDSVVWVGSYGQSMTAVSTTTHAPLFEQFMGSTPQDCDVDTLFNNLWCIGTNSGVSYISVFSMTSSVQTQGQANYQVWTGVIANGGPYSISVDATDRIAFITSGGVLVEWSIKTDQEGIIKQLSTPDGYTIQNASYMPICNGDTGLMVTAVGSLNGHQVSDWWYYDLGTRCIQGGGGWFPGNTATIEGENGLFVPTPMLKPVSVTGYGEQILAQSEPLPNGYGGSWLVSPPFGQQGFAWLNYNIDAYMNTYPLEPNYATGQAFDPHHTIYISVMTTYDDAVPGNPPGPNQVIFAPASGGTWPYPGNVQPGITVAHAVYVTVDGTNRVAYTSGTDGMVTAISY